jgi:hypothetical protein
MEGEAGVAPGGLDPVPETDRLRGLDLDTTGNPFGHDLSTIEEGTPSLTGLTDEKRTDRGGEDYSVRTPGPRGIGWGGFPFLGASLLNPRLYDFSTISPRPRIGG